MPIGVGENWWVAWLPRWLVRWFRWILIQPPQPGALTVRSMMEVRMLRYTVDMPPKPPIADLATREVTISLAGVDTIRSLEPEETSFQFDTDAGVAVELSCVDIDTSGNRSQRSPVLAFTATDNVPPPAPGGMSVASVEQIDELPTQPPSAQQPSPPKRKP